MTGDPRSAQTAQGNRRQCRDAGDFLAAWQWGTGPARHRDPSSCRRCPRSPPSSATRHASTICCCRPASTVAEVLAGFILGSLLGAFAGYMLGMSPTAELALSPYILALQIAPKVAFAPLFILWMGFTVYPKILVAILIVFFPVMVNVLTAVRTVDPDLINLARAFKATRAQIFWKIEFPTSMPPMFAGLRIGATLAVVGVVVGELVGGNVGLGLSAHLRRRPGQHAAGVRLDRDAHRGRRHRLSGRDFGRAPRAALSAGAAVLAAIFSAPLPLVGRAWPRVGRSQSITDYVAR